MIDLAALERSFYPVTATDALVRAGDELPDRTIHSYFLLPAATGAPVPFTVCDGAPDDGFARLLLEAGAGPVPQRLEKRALADNRYGFTHLLRLPPHYHRELAGRLDEARASAVLVLPCHEPEFSGDESAEVFAAMRNRLVATKQWDRTVQPRLQLRFDNPRTGAGTGEGYVPSGFQQAMEEVGNLLEAPDGFVEVLDYRGRATEVLCADGWFTVIPDRDDGAATVADFDEVGDILWARLNGG